MKIEYLTHASVLIESGGVRLVTDPWLVGPSWGGNLWHFPPPICAPEQLPKLDYIYFSHAHDDHFHPESVARLSAENKEACVLIPGFAGAWFEKLLRDHGFRNIRILAHDETIELTSDTSLQMFLNDKGDIDSSIMIREAEYTAFFQTDNLMSLEEAARIGAYNDIDIAFVMAVQTGIFPAFYDFPPDKMKQMARAKAEHSLDYCTQVVERLSAKIIVPYAGDICYLGELYFANDLHRINRDIVTAHLKRTLPKVRVEPMMPGDIFESVGNRFTHGASVSSPSLDGYAATMADAVADVEADERKYMNQDYRQDVAKFLGGVDRAAKKWSGETFSVLWCITDPHHAQTFYAQELPKACVPADGTAHYDLRVEIPTYRLQRLVRGDYPMGTMTFWNGSIRCHRHTDGLTPLESAFWRLFFEVRP